MFDELPCDQTDSVFSTTFIRGINGEGIQVTHQGKPARLAVIDENGNVLESSPEVSVQVLNTILKAHRAFMLAQGHLKVMSNVPFSQTINQAA